MTKDQLDGFENMSSAQQAVLLSSYERIIELSRLLTATLELPTLLQVIIEAARELTNSEASSILLVDRKSGELYFEAATGSQSEQQQMLRLPVPIDSSIAGWVVKNDEPMVVDDARQDQRHFQMSEDVSSLITNSLIAVPMRLKGKVIGVLEVINKKDCLNFGEQDVSLLTTLAAQAAVAIENAHLFQQSDLISEMVHELRTPLTSILAYSDMLIEAPLSQDQRIQFLETIRDEADRLSNLTNDFLDVARLASGRATLNRELVNLAKIIHNAVNVLRPQAVEQGIRIMVRTGEGLAQVWGDEKRIHQIVLNLVSNAVKYNKPNGSVTVATFVEDDWLRVKVSDTGKGISPENLPRMFEKFFRESDAEGYARGTGLGLAITKQLIEAHGGQIEVESELDVGTIFTFTLPLTKNKGEQ